MTRSRKILKRLESLHPKQIDLSLERINLLLNKLGNPENKLPKTIHIAGTNGKGSTLAFLRSMLEEDNHKVDVYTSPHLINFNERIRINSRIISDDYLSELLEECEFFNEKLPITFFEITTAAAYLAFSRGNSDFLLLETGLGGRFDATNVIPKSICNVITPISMDHMSFLGNSIELITNEKIGIFKKNIPAVISKQENVAMDIIQHEAKNKHVPIFTFGLEWDIENIDYHKKKFTYNFGGITEKVSFPNLYGEHQILNASTAISVMKVIQKNNHINNIFTNAVTQTSWPARMQQLKNGKLNNIVGEKFEIWLDGGHNYHASEMLYQNLKKWKNYDLFLVFGMIKSKDPYNYLNNIIDKVTNIQVVPIQEQSFIEPDTIIKNLKTNNCKIIKSKGIDDSLSNIKEKYDSGKIIICGSLYLAGEVLKKNNFDIN